ncbi:hypothetical protein [Bacillus mycoides]
MKVLRDQLGEWKEQSRQAKKRHKKKRKENLITRDIEGLMCIHRLRYERR